MDDREKQTKLGKEEKPARTGIPFKLSYIDIRDITLQRRLK